jgi:DNA-binding transcriptional ArsR family regulator
MAFLFFGRKKKLDILHQNLKNSFTNIKKDIKKAHIRVSGLYHIKDDHHDKLNSIITRLEVLETLFNKLKIKEKHIQEEVEERISSTLIDDLTDKQKIFCQRLAALQKENPDQWISLKYLSQEIYPNKNYPQIRSTVSQYVTFLEELGIVKRRRKGKQAYVRSTKKNPFFKKKKNIEIEEKF